MSASTGGEDPTAAEAIVLIHGFSGTGAVWEPMAAELARSHRVLTVELAGHARGQALAHGREATVAALVDAVEADMAAAGIERAHIVGNSLGGWIALELAQRGRAHTVTGIAPAGGWTAGSSEERRLRSLFTRNHRLSSLIAGRLDGLMRRPRIRRALLAQVVAHGGRVPPAAAAQMVRDAIGCSIYFELMEAILRDGPPSSFAGVSCPAMLVWGTKDRILPSGRYSARMRELVPAALWVELDGLGHVPMLDDPGLLAGTVADFLAAQAQPLGAGTP